MTKDYCSDRSEYLAILNEQSPVFSDELDWAGGEEGDVQLCAYDTTYDEGPHDAGLWWKVDVSWRLQRRALGCPFSLTLS